MDKDSLLSLLENLAFGLKIVKANASQAKAEAFKFDDLSEALDGLDAAVDGIEDIRNNILSTKENLEYMSIMEGIGK